jgi:hypothetical protein
VIGTVKLLLSFEEDRDALLWSSKPRAAPGRTVEDLNVDTIKRYVERAQVRAPLLLLYVYTMHMCVKACRFDIGV